MDGGGDMDFPDLDDLTCSDVGNYFFAGVCEDTAEHLTCTHTHICVPPVDDPSHTHTCVHVHATTVAAAAAPPPPDAASPSGPSNKPGPPDRTGNRAAVRKYREKNKAKAATMEQQVHHLIAQNQYLTKRNAELEAEKLLRDAELTRFRCLLVEFRGRIDGEIGPAFPNQNQNRNQNQILRAAVNNIDLHQHGAFPGGSCDFRCNNDQMTYCSNPAGPGIMMMQGTSSGQVVLGQQAGACDGVNIQCTGSTNLPFCGGMDTGPADGWNIKNVEN